MKVSITGANGCSADSTYQVYVSSLSEPSAGLTSGLTGLSCAPTTLSFFIDFRLNSKGTNYTFSANDGSDPVVYQHPPPDTIFHDFEKSSCGTESSDGTTTFSNSFKATIKVDNACGTKIGNVLPLRISGKPSAAISMPATTCINTVLDLTNAGNYGTVVSAFGCDNTGKAGMGNHTCHRYAGRY